MCENEGQFLAGEIGRMQRAEGGLVVGGSYGFHYAPTAGRRFESNSS